LKAEKLIYRNRSKQVELGA